MTSSRIFNFKFNLECEKNFLFECDEKPNNFLWHLRIPSMRIRRNRDETLIAAEKNIKIAILDTQDFLSGEFGEKSCLNSFNKSVNRKDSLKTEQGCTRKPSLAVGLKNENRLTGAMTKNQIKLLFQKKHSEISCAIIRQISPNVTIIPIKILDDNGEGDLPSLITGLKKARKLKVDILHIGVSISCKSNSDIKNYNRVISLFKKFTYVVMPAGNNRIFADFSSEKLLLQAQKNIISVGAVCSENNSYKISDFSENYNKNWPRFVLPGEDIWAKILIEADDISVYVKTSGTSCACALMTGFLSLLLAEFNKGLSQKQIVNVMKKCAKTITQQETKKLQFALVNMQRTIDFLRRKAKVV